MKPVSLFGQGTHTRTWVKDFYDQAGIWWGSDPQEPGVHEKRAGVIERLFGTTPHRILELGCGAGHTAAALAEHGHDVTGVELSSQRAAFAQELIAVPRRGRLRVIEADFYTVQLGGDFDLVLCFETFGIGSDTDQRRLLRRISQEWLAGSGRALVEVYNPMVPSRDAGTQVRLDPLPGVEGSVEMIEKCHFDAVLCRWIDEWQPVAAPEKALAQSIRCYSPADLLLLLEGTGLTLAGIEVDGQAVPFGNERINTSSPLAKSYSYLVMLAPIGS
jgi:SAM-dependent methyltransferase